MDKENVAFACTHTMGVIIQNAIQKNEILPFTTTWLEMRALF